MITEKHKLFCFVLHRFFCTLLTNASLRICCSSNIGFSLQSVMQEQYLLKDTPVWLAQHITAQLHLDCICSQWLGSSSV